MYPPRRPVGHWRTAIHGSTIRFVSGRPRLVVFASVAALALGGCGDDDGGSGSSYGGGQSSTPKNVVATIEVKETEYALNPANPGVEDAGKVAFEVTNAGKIGHALEIEGPKGEQETDEIAPGETAKLTVDMGKPGKYTWYCPIADHEQQGMTGSVFIAYDKVKGTDQPRKKGEAGPGSDGHGGY